MKMGGYRWVKRSAIYESMKTENAGFTIVETLIVLAVTGALLVSAIALIQGKQSKTEFYTAINAAQQQIQQIINESTSGYYPNNGHIVCDGSTTPVTLSYAVSGNAAGSNTGCIFLGKGIQFGTQSDPTQLAVLPLVGNQFLPSTTDPVTLLSQANPRAVAPTNGATPAADASTYSQMQGGLTVATGNVNGGVYYYPVGSSTATATGAALFLSGDRQGNIGSVDGNNNLQSGSQQLSLWVVNSSSPNQNVTTTSSQIGNVLTVRGTSRLTPADKVLVCLASGGTNQSGLITIDSGLNVTLQVFSGDTTC